MEALSDEVIQAETRASQLSIEALAARLPELLGANFVVERSNKIRQRFQIISKLVSSFIDIIPKWVLERTRLLAPDHSDATKRREMIRGVMPPVVITFLPLILVGFFLFTKLLDLIKKSDMQGWVTVGLLLCVFAMLGSICFPYMVRTYGKRIGPTDLVKLIFRLANIKNFLGVGKVVGGIVVFMTLTVPFGYLIEWSARKILNVTLVTEQGYTYPNMMSIGFIALMLLLYSFGFIMLVRGIYKNRTNNRRWSRNLIAAKQAESTDFYILYSASDLEELKSWLKSDEQLLSQQESLRAFSSLILNRLRYLAEDEASKSSSEAGDLPVCFRGKKIARYELTSVLRALEGKHVRTF